jgi:hypothetical protein
MKSLKALGLTAVAAMALTAFFGAGSASATVLCTTTSTPCGSSWHVDTIEASLKSGTTTSLHSTGGSLEATCTGSTLKATKESTGGATTTPVVSVTAANLTWSGCAQKTETVEGGGLEIHSISGSENGTVTASRFHITFVIAGLNCTFNFGSTDAGVLTGGSSATFEINGLLSKVGGSFLCPQDSVWTAEYQITNHTSAYVEPE